MTSVNTLRNQVEATAVCEQTLAVENLHRHPGVQRRTIAR